MPNTLPVTQQLYPSKGYGQTAKKKQGWGTGMITAPLGGLGLQLAVNAVLKNGEVHKMTGNSLFQETTEVEEVLKLGEYIKSDATFQVIKIYRRLASLTGVITFANGSTAVSASGGAFTTELTVGEQVFLDTDGRTFTAEISSITNNDNLVLTANYTGTGGAGASSVLSYRFRAITEAGVVVVPTGGAGDVIFTSEIFGYVQIALTGYVTNKVTDASGKNAFSWDGEALTTMTNVADNPEWAGSEGRRLIVGAGGVVHYSRADNNPVTSFTGGADVNTEGQYRVNQPGIPTGYVNTGTGTLLGFTTGVERHNIRELDVGGGLFIETRSREFSYTGPGVIKPEHITKGSYFVYILATDGIIRVNPVSGNNPKTGKVDHLIDDDTGKIKDYWQLFDINKAQITYSPKEEMIIATLATDDVQSNDLLVCYHEPTGAITFKVNSNFRSLAVVNRQLYGGSAVDGKVHKVFDDGTFQNGSGGDTQFRIINEWDAVTSMQQEKVIIDILAAINTAPDIPLTLNVYVDGFTDDPLFSLTFTADDVDDTSSLVSVLGKYIMGIGDPDEPSNTEKLQRIQGGEPFKYWCWELIEESQSGLIARDVQILYEPLETLPLAADLGSVNKLFPIN
jgi:hypothetical protein